MNKARDTAITFRLATIDDSNTLHQWRNHISVREYSLNKDTIPIEVHEEWFKKKITSNESIILMVNHHSIAVGSIRIDKEIGPKDDIYSLLSWMINPKFQRKGYGTQLLLHITQKSASPLFATIMQTNKASIAIAVKARFECLSYPQEHYQRYCYTPQNTRLKSHIMPWKDNEARGLAQLNDAEKTSLLEFFS